MRLEHFSTVAVLLSVALHHLSVLNFAQNECELNESRTNPTLNSTTIFYILVKFGFCMHRFGPHVKCVRMQACIIFSSFFSLCFVGGVFVSLEQHSLHNIHIECITLKVSEYMYLHLISHWARQRVALSLCTCRGLNNKKYTQIYWASFLHVRFIFEKHFRITVFCLPCNLYGSFSAIKIWFYSSTKFVIRNDFLSPSIY